MKTFIVLAAVSLASYCTACSPTVQMEAPDKPITVNLNIKIEHEVRVKVDKELDGMFKKDSGLF